MKEKLLASFQDLADGVVAGTPQVLIGIVLLVAGVVVAKIVEKVLRIILQRLHFDKLMQRTGLDQTLQKLGIRQQINQFLPRLVYFLILVLLAKTLADSMGLVAISDAFGAFFSYLPNLVAGLLLLIIGTAVAQFVGDTVRNASESAGLDFAPSLGRAVTVLLIFIVGVMAVSQLQFDTEMIRLVTSFVLGAGAIAFGLSFGLGAREITRHVLAGFYARKILQMGESIEVAGERGILQAITATHTIVQQEQKSLSIANATLLEEIVKQ